MPGSRARAHPPLALIADHYIRHLGGDGEARYARGRLGPRREYAAYLVISATTPTEADVAIDRSVSDRAPAADRRGDPQGRKARVDAGRRVGARLGQAALLLWI